MRVYTARWVVPVSAPPVRDGAVAVDGAGRIAYVGPAHAAPTGARHALGDAVLLPGLVAIDPALAGEPGTDARGATDRGARTGVTTRAMRVERPDDLAVLLASGVRGVAYHPVVGRAPADRAPAFAALQAAVARSDAAIAAAGAVDRVRIGVSPGPVFAVDEELLIDACAWAVGERLPLAIAAGASADEVAFIREAGGPHADAWRAAGLAPIRRAHSTVHLLAEIGVAAVARPLLVGAAAFDASDVALAAYYDCPVALVADGAGGPFAELREAGARVTVASGGADPLTAARAVATNSADALRLVTLSAARALGLGDEIGSLDVGKSADLCAFVLDASAVDTGDPVAALLDGLRSSPVLATVQGRDLVGVRPD